ncbi:Thiol-disulfide isomerase or thioredoxin [Quadrisphaera granulorum]|uniref:Thiol-disulfide isomerase/thioredoxin n=1 Tax=Quadrisphaera granulorum TaxID=317664 RepID=A0A316A7Q3_9ACTN|nr:TlpA disulfide reductase family protein [Quadrisphaera granulorum]PWJ53248.1 thiol-disulfide isomerase/thioredoxin [Quadrisphaera granulorum]SZE96922.1 Thiol-disulfide isomerase or thioredoxin [Quadrisphaera granulorum]
MSEFSGQHGAARQHGPSRRALLAGALALPAAAALAACDGLGQAGGDTGNQQGYVSGTGDLTILAASQRSAPVVLSGPTSHGPTLDIADWRGQVVVINVWWAACAPCRVEAPELAAVANDTPGVQWLGINTRDDAAVAQTFEREFGIPYPSVLDAGSGQGLLALRGTIPPQAVPSTVVLDTEGRPAARIVGRAQKSVLRGVIDDVVSGRADNGDSGAGGSA